MDKFSKQERIVILFLGAIIFVGGIIFLFTQRSEIKIASSEKQKQDKYLKKKDTEKKATKKEEELIYVQIYGAVGKPGIYKIERGMRLFEIIQHAQPLSVADINRLNLTTKVLGDTKIYVPQIGEVRSSGETKSNIININTATIEQLDTLPGIGKGLAERIIKHRETKGNFTKIEDIKNVAGIGVKKFENIKDLIAVH